MVRQRTRSRCPRAPIAACRCVLICTPVHYIQRELRFDLYNGKLVAGQIRLLSAIRGYDDKAGNVSAGYPAHSHLSLPAPPTHPLPLALNPPPPASCPVPHPCTPTSTSFPRIPPTPIPHACPAAQGRHVQRRRRRLRRIQVQEGRMHRKRKLRQGVRQLLSVLYLTEQGFENENAAAQPALNMPSPLSARPYLRVRRYLLRWTWQLGRF